MNNPVLEHFKTISAAKSRAEEEAARARQAQMDQLQAQLVQATNQAAEQAQHAREAEQAAQQAREARDALQAELETLRAQQALEAQQAEQAAQQAREAHQAQLDTLRAQQAQQAEQAAQQAREAHQAQLATLRAQQAQETQQAIMHAHLETMQARQTSQALEQQNASLRRRMDELQTELSTAKRPCVGPVGDGLFGSVRANEFSSSLGNWELSQNTYWEQTDTDTASFGPTTEGWNPEDHAEMERWMESRPQTSHIASQPPLAHPAFASSLDPRVAPVPAGIRSDWALQPVRLVASNSSLAQGAAEDTDDSDQEDEPDKSEPSFAQVYTSGRSNFPTPILKGVRSIKVLQTAVESFTKDPAVNALTTSAAQAVVAGLKSLKKADFKALQKDANSTVEQLLQAWKTACQQGQQMPILRKHFGMKIRS